MKKITPKLVLLIIILGVSAVFISKNIFFSIQPANSSQIKEYANQVLEKCSSENHKPTCFDREIPKLMRRITMEDAFKVTRHVQEKYPEYLYCHVLGHNIAEQETRKDPSKWKDVVSKCPAMMCNNGCPHGALMEKFKENINDYLTDEQIEEITIDLTDVCEPRLDGSWTPQEIERSMCYHALGHLHMYITNGNLRKSAELCNKVGIKNDGRNYVQTCTEGVFMSIYQPLGPEDIALVKDITPTKESMPDFCGQYMDNEMSFHACRKEAWAIFRDEVATPKGYSKFCDYTDDLRWRQSCYSSLMNPLTDIKIITENDFDWLKNFCGKVSEDAQEYCIKASAHRLMQVDPKLLDRALILCQNFGDYGGKLQGYCYESLAYFGILGFQKGSAEFNQYCSSLPDKWSGVCLNNDSYWH